MPEKLQSDEENGSAFFPFNASKSDNDTIIVSNEDEVYKKKKNDDFN